MDGSTIDSDCDFVCARIIRSLATAADTDPLELEPPLYDVVDVEALARILAGDDPVTVTFGYNDHDVVVRDEAIVSIDGTVYDP